ncbi:Uncharacterised protein [Collinsella aerofaciens]|uniref:Uncharacterized protein n=1 Tax=Collinsella aerofaciens TaxID=74426 RepID=A0A5K1JBZ6_9ACTN|nr:Uncharacterised protein [Collinsella aerofaciens]
MTRRSDVADSLVRMGRAPVRREHLAARHRAGEQCPRPAHGQQRREQDEDEVATDYEGKRDANAAVQTAKTAHLPASHLYPTPHTVAMGSTPATRSLARALPTWTETAASSVSLPQPRTASRICARP